MSSFFRPASEVSESGETSISESLDLSHVSQPGNDEDIDDNPIALSAASQHNQNILFHALLEDKCLNDVYHELNATSQKRISKNDPEVRSRAAQRYQSLTGQLASHGLAHAGLEHDRYSHVRQTARDGLTLLSQQLDALDMSGNEVQHHARLIPAPFRRLITESTTSHPLKAAQGEGLPSTIQFPIGLTSHLLPSHPLLDSTRYIRDFEEVRILGKGGYGSVYHVNHRLDGRSYAVKKIALAPSALLRVQRRGEAELTDILRELRTLAKLEHCNIVRYFGGWVEWSTTTDPSGSASQERRLLTERDTTSVSDRSETSASKDPKQTDWLAASTGASDHGVVFEDSEEREASNDQQIIHLPQRPSLRHVRTRSTVATVSDEEVETIERPDMPSIRSSVEDDVYPTNDNSPTLTLHIQMSLYPLTLGQYLHPCEILLDDTQLNLQHCYHLEATTSLMLAILSGVDYLHQNGIVHRDLKPANIFLSPRLCNANHAPYGSINPLACRGCTASIPSNDSTNGDRLNMSVCVGDFGLVSTLRPVDPSLSQATTTLNENSEGASTSMGGASPDPAVPVGPLEKARQVGTPLYRPPTPVTSAHESEDMYALAIIFVELLVRFDTRMERFVTLSNVREGTLPDSLDGQGMDGVAALIKDMLASPLGKGKGLGCREVSERMGALLIREKQ